MILMSLIVSLLGDDIVNKMPVFQSRMHSQCLVAVWLLKVGVGEYNIEFSAKETMVRKAAGGMKGT